MPACDTIRIGISIRTEKFIPKIVDESKVAIAICMVNKMKLLLSSEPCKS
jgi:hypothetical protein